MDDLFGTEYVLEREGCSLHYWLSGPVGRPLVVLTHGAGLDHRSWAPQLGALAERYRVLTWDVRGHGLSRPWGQEFSIALAAADLPALLDAAGYGEAFLVGLSMGGNISQEVVFRHPKRVRALAALDCTCNTLRLSLLDRWLLSLSPAMLAMYPWERLKQLSARLSSVKATVRRYIYETLSRMTKAEFVDVMLKTGDCLRYEPGYRIALPLLLLRGQFDGLGNIRDIMPRWAAREPRCRYVLVPDAGHCANQDNPASVNAQLLRFLAAQAELDGASEAAGT